MNTIEQRKQNWIDFMDVKSNTNRLLLVDCAEDMPKRPLLWWENAAKRVEWSYERCMRLAEQTEWLDDNTIPFMSMITGTEIFAEALGCSVHKPLDNNPCAIPLISSAEEAYKIQFPKVEDTKLSILFEMADRLKAKAGKDALLSFPDLQTPMDVLALLWDKSDLFVAMYESPELIKELSCKIKLFMFDFLDQWIARYGSATMAHYPDYYMPSGITISEDEIGVVSTDMYKEFFQPEITELANRYGAIGMHCCANSMHQWENLKQIPNLKLLNLIRPNNELVKACEFFRHDIPQFMGEDIDWSSIKSPNEIHFAKYMYVDTKQQAKQAVEDFKRQIIK